MLTLRSYWSTVQKQLEEKECYSPDDFEIWVYRFKYTTKFLQLRNRCFEKLHSYPGSDEIAISYMDIGNCLGCAYPESKFIIINPFHLLCTPDFIIKTIVPHEYIHIMLGSEKCGHSDEFFQYFEAVTGEKHPPNSLFMSRKECKYHLETVRSHEYALENTFDKNSQC